MGSTGTEKLGLAVRLLRPLRSNGVRAALVVVAAAYGAEFGVNIDTSMGEMLLGVGVAAALGHLYDRKIKTAAEQNLPDDFRVELGPAYTDETKPHSGK